jgi:predicted transposase YdaD
MVRQLLETCVDEGWVSELVIEGLEPMSTNLVDKRLIRRQDDVLLRARLRGREVYVLIALEFQSKPDRFMTLRLLSYQCIVWLSLVERSRRAKGEPAVTLPRP